MNPEQPASAFEFDRPYSHGLSAPSFGEGAFTGVEAREVLVDLIRDAVLRHYDPSETLVQAGADPTGDAKPGG
jgi:hypothetical protein